MKSLKLPNGQSESVYQRTDNIMTKIKKYKQKNNDTYKTKDRVTLIPP
jgi:hypothetical protein